MPGTGANSCPVLRPTKAQFSKPFKDYIAAYFRKHPEVPIIKVIPPQGYVPRKSQYPTDLKIEAPIEQRVLLHDNKPGYYDCALVQQKTLTVQEFENVATERGVPKQGRGAEEDELLERPFWSSITSRPPLYGADTPLSLFDKKLAFGWNLQSLECLLSKYKVPAIPGVTTPMTYYGMWKAFFSWHVEDVDLLSINYLHYGASKVWYAIAPGASRKRFEDFARTLYPNDAKSCSNFLRHKNVMITPRLIRDEGIPMVTVKQNAGEFIVLNAGAYHAGFNQGFNCAEAVNFATEDWIPLGKEATRCDCRAMGKDAVSVDMRVFPGCEETSSSSDESDDDSEMEEGGSDEGSSNAPRRLPSKQARNKVTQKHGANGKKGPGRPRKAAPPPATDSDHSQGSADHGSKLKARAPPMKVKAAKQTGTGKSGKAVGGKKMRETKEGRRRQGSAPDVNAQAPTRKRKAQQPDSSDSEPTAKRARDNTQAPKRADKNKKLQVKRKPGRPRKHPLPQATDPPPSTQSFGQGLKPSGPRLLDGLKINVDRDVVSEPFAVIGRQDETGAKYFYLVQKLSRQADPGKVMVRWLQENNETGQWYETNSMWQEDVGALLQVRTQAVYHRNSNRPFYRLLTMRSKILNVDLED